MIVFEVANISAFKNDKDAAAPALDRCNIINIVSVVGYAYQVANYEPVGSLEYAVRYVFHRVTSHKKNIQAAIELNIPAFITMRAVSGSKNWPRITVKIGISTDDNNVMRTALFLSSSVNILLSLFGWSIVNSLCVSQKITRCCLPDRYRLGRV